MWHAKYKNTSRNGLNPELNVTIVFYNDFDDSSYEDNYYLLPDDFNMKSIQEIVQKKIDFLNYKDMKLANTDIVINNNVTLK